MGLGYTSNSYRFDNQPLEHAFYVLAKPQKTMVVGFGNDAVGQCDVPMGVTNALMVAAGGGQTLALLNDGTVRAWGQNSYGQGSVPTNLAGVTMISAGWYHNVALLTNGTISAWGLNAHGLYNLTEVPAGLSNVTVISAQALHSLALSSNGTVTAWGYGPDGEASVPAGISNVVAMAAGYQFNVVAKADGTVTAWGNNAYGQINTPVGLSNVVDVSAGTYHSLALLKNGTVVAWGDGSDGETNVPSGLTNVVAIIASGDPLRDSVYSLALKSDGTVVAWGGGEPAAPVAGMTNVIAVGAGADHALAIRTGPPTAVITLEPTDQYQVAGGNVTFSARGSGLYGVTYQWQANGVSISGATNATLTRSNVQVEGYFNVTIGNELGNITSPNANLHLVTVPFILTQTPLPTNQIVARYQPLTLSVIATAVGQSQGFPLTYQWKHEGTNIPGGTANTYTLYADSNTVGNYSVIVSNAAGSAQVAWKVAQPDDSGYFAAGTLGYHLSTNLVARTSGISDIYNATIEIAGWIYDTYYATNMAHLTNSTWSTNFWLRGVRGLSATSIGFSNGVAAQGSVTMISPRHCIYAKHMHEAPGHFTAAFLGTNNVIYWRTNMQNVTVSGDTSIGILDSELPASVGFLPLLPTNYSNYLPTNGWSAVQGIGRNQDVRMFGQPMTFSSLAVNWNANSTAPFGLTTAWNVLLRVGDSSNPETLLAGNQLILVSHNTAVDGGPNYAAIFAQINQSMHFLSTNNYAITDYQLTPYPLTNWPAINH